MTFSNNPEDLCFVTWPWKYQIFCTFHLDCFRNTLRNVQEIYRFIFEGIKGFYQDCQKRESYQRYFKNLLKSIMSTYLC